MSLVNACVWNNQINQERYKEVKQIRQNLRFWRIFNAMLFQI